MGFVPRISWSNGPDTELSKNNFSNTFIVVKDSDRRGIVLATQQIGRDDRGIVLATQQSGRW